MKDDFEEEPAGALPEMSHRTRDELHAASPEEAQHQQVETHCLPNATIHDTLPPTHMASG